MKKKNWLFLVGVSLIIIVITACSPQVKTDPLQPQSLKTNVDLDQEIHTISRENTNDLKRKDQTVEQAVEQDEETSAPKIYRTTGNLNLRQEASLDSQILATIPEGESVEYISSVGDWDHISYGGETGYASNQYLQEVVQTSNGTVSENVDKVPILMYHAIDEYIGKGIKELYVTPDNFKQQMTYLKSSGFTPITFEDIEHLDKVSKPILVTLDDGYQNNMNAYQILQDLNSADFHAKAVIFMIGKKIDTKTGLSSAQLKEMSDSGIISIQSHTETHPELPDIQHYEAELGEIKDKLEGITGKKINAIAYPAGKYDERVIEETRKYYNYAVTTNPGMASLSTPYELNRIRVSYSTTLEEFQYLLGEGTVQ